MCWALCKPMSAFLYPMKFSYPSAYEGLEVQGVAWTTPWTMVWPRPHSNHITAAKFIWVFRSHP